MDKKPIFFAIISVLCPIVAVTAVEIYQSYMHAGFWESITPEYSFVGAMMGVGEVIESGLALLVGCSVGIIFAILSLVYKRKFLSLGVLALIFNISPIVILISVYIGPSRG